MQWKSSKEKKTGEVKSGNKNYSAILFDGKKRLA
jgi:hypothetical protein